jgi:hypothetical protein
MRGAAELIALRMRRRMPSSVVLSLHERPGQRADEAWLMPGPLDRPDTALRLLVGLRVVVAGPAHSGADVTAWCTAAERAGALVVLGYATDKPLLRDTLPLYAGGDINELTRRIAALEPAHG